MTEVTEHAQTSQTGTSQSPQRERENPQEAHGAPSQGAADARLRSQQPTESPFHLLCRDGMGPGTLGIAYTDTGWNRD